MTGARRGIFAYPWTIIEQGEERSVARMKNELHLDDLYVSVNYHAGRLFQPLSANKVYMRHHSTWSFEPESGRYPQDMNGLTDAELAGSRSQHRIRQACLQQGVGYHAWVVGTHNSTLGRAHPDWCVRNAFGDTYDYALCPNHPLVQAYMEGLVADVCANLKPQSVLLESFGFLGFVHGHHHEKVLANLGPVAEYLWSLCFCDHCRRRAKDAGQDSDRLQANVRGMASRLTEQERGHAGTEFAHAELACLLLEEPELYAYTQMRNDVVTQLVSSLKTIAARANVRLLAMPAIVSSRSWMEGAALKQLSTIVDGWIVLTYYAEPDRVKADLDWLRLFIGKAVCQAGLNAGAPTTGSAVGLASCADAALDAGAQGIVYYHLSMLTRTRLGWIADVNRSLA